MAAWKSYTVHSAWALAVAGAWWLGRHPGADGAAGTGGRSRDGIQGPGHGRAGLEAALPVSVPPRCSVALAGTGEWLRQWSGPGGMISPERMSAAVQAALAEPDAVTRMQHFSHLLSALTPENAAAAATVLSSHASPEAPGWLTMLAGVWGTLDGEAAMKALGGSTPRNIEAPLAALAAWTAVSPRLAQAWLREHAPVKGSKEENLIPYQNAVVRGLDRRDPAEAIAYIKGLSENRDHLVSILAIERYRGGVEAAGEWAAQLPDESMRRRALETVARRYSGVDPAGAADWGAGIASQPDAREAVARVADRMAENDVRAAFDWTVKLPAGPGQDEAFQQVFSEWARQDPGASSEVLQAMTPGRERDNAVHAFSRILVNESPQDAIIWASNISDPALRLDTQVDVARRWNQTDPAAAGAWVTSHLTGGDRTRALESPND